MHDHRILWLPIVVGLAASLVIADVAQEARGPGNMLVWVYAGALVAVVGAVALAVMRRRPPS